MWMLPSCPPCLRPLQEQSFQLLDSEARACVHRGESTMGPSLSGAGFHGTVVPSGALLAFITPAVG